MTQLFSIAGVSRRYGGPFKARFANDMTRIKTLEKTGHSDIDLIELTHPMDKESAVSYLLSIDFDNGRVEVRQALESEVDKRQPKVSDPDAPKAKRGRPKKVVVEAAPAEAAEEPAAEAAEAAEEAEQVPGGEHTEEVTAEAEAELV